MFEHVSRHLRYRMCVLCAVYLAYVFVHVQDAIMAAMEGYHSSVFLYGQTGTGKTYTMQVGDGLMDV